MKALGYYRSPRQGTTIPSYCESVGLKLGEVLSDEVVGVISGDRQTMLMSRAGYVELLETAALGKVAFIIVEDLDDLLPVPESDIDPLEELMKMGVNVAQVGDQLFIPRPKENPRRRRFVNRPARPKETIAQRLLRGREAGARAGKHQSGPAPFGYMRDYSARTYEGVKLIPDPEEAEIVKLIFKEYLRRKSMKRVIESLNSQKITTRRGKRWSRAGISWILKNETYLGRVHFGKIRAKGRHPAIISPIIFNKVQKLMKKNNKRGGKAKTNVDQPERIPA